MLLVRTVRRKKTAHGLRRQLIWLVVVTHGAVGLKTWNASANAKMRLQWCAAGRTFCAAMVVVCLGRSAMLAVRSLVLTPRVAFNCVLGLL